MRAWKSNTFKKNNRVYPKTTMKPTSFKNKFRD